MTCTAIEDYNRLPRPCQNQCRTKSAASILNEPQRGYLTTRPFKPWDGLDTAELPAWDAVNRKYWSPMVIAGGQPYELYLEIPDLTGREPE